MAVIRKKGKREVAAYSSSSMSDIIFMLLFFFMITTTMRESEMLVQIKLPSATESQKLEKKSLASYIYVGSPTQQLRRLFGDSPRIQLNDAYKQPWEIGEFIASERDQLDEADRSGMTVVLKADQNIHMGLITDVKQELRKAEATKLIYAASRPETHE
ncbi:biopolymer transporter ExbD [Alistipes sp. OttesenSCG-928-L06]|nr:biopolymer transporter ExbD [Alistipes sp. OttesenSCG-928-L06]